MTIKLFDRRRLTVLFITVVTLLIVIAGCGGFYCVNRLLQHEYTQSREINRLAGIVSEVRERQRRETDYYDYQVTYSSNSADVNYLAIGNSLTLITSWGRGICATAPDLDYYGLVCAYLRDSLDNFSLPSTLTVVTHSADNTSVDSASSAGSASSASGTERADVIAHRWNFAIWEKASDRAAVLDLLDPFLSPRLNLITIQLGENVPIYSPDDLTRYEKDLAELVDYIRAAAPKAQVIIIDDFWSQEKSDVRRRVAELKGCPFADLSSIRGKREYQSRAGTVCLIPAMSSHASLRSVSASSTTSNSAGVGVGTETVVSTSVSKDLQKSDGSEHSSQGNTPENEGTEDTERETGHALLEPILVSEEAATHPGDEGMRFISEQVIKEITQYHRRTGD